MHPTIELEISKIFNMYSYLETAGTGPVDQGSALRQSFDQLRRLRSYSPGVGLWGLFEEAIAASQGLQDLGDNLDRACTALRGSITSLAENALPELEEEWQRRKRVLEARRAELAPAWASRESELMDEIQRLFATPWEGPDTGRIKVNLVYSTVHAAKSRPFVLGVADQPLGNLIADMVHELLHRNSFGSARSGLWSKLQLFYFSTGIPHWLGHEITHTIITWAGCTISARVWDLDLDQVYHGFYDDTINPQQESLDALAEIWPAFEAGEIKPMELMRHASKAIGEAVGDAADSSPGSAGAS